MNCPNGHTRIKIVFLNFHGGVFKNCKVFLANFKIIETVKKGFLVKKMLGKLLKKYLDNNS